MDNIAAVPQLTDQSTKSRLRSRPTRCFSSLLFLSLSFPLESKQTIVSVVAFKSHDASARRACRRPECRENAFVLLDWQSIFIVSGTKLELVLEKSLIFIIVSIRMDHTASATWKVACLSRTAVGLKKKRYRTSNIHIFQATASVGLLDSS